MFERMRRLHTRLSKLNISKKQRLKLTVPMMARRIYARATCRREFIECANVIKDFAVFCMYMCVSTDMYIFARRRVSKQQTGGKAAEVRERQRQRREERSREAGTEEREAETEKEA